MNKFKYIIILVFLLLPITCFAKSTIRYDDAKIKFSIDESVWTKAELTKDRVYIDKKWTSDCGTIMTGTYDIYAEFDEEELKNISREYINYKNIFNESSAASIAETFKEEYSIDHWEYVDYKVKFINFTGTGNQNGIGYKYDTYVTINNGYAFMIQYMRLDLDFLNHDSCGNPIAEIVASVSSTTKVKELKENNMNWLELLLNLSVGIILTFISYEAYPFIRVVIMKKKYSAQEAKKMALWNSIILGGIFFILTMSLNENATWSAAPAFLYYYINKHMWVKSKSKSKTKSGKKEENVVVCGNCGYVVKESAKSCPNCKVSFVETDESDEILDEEYSSVCSNCGKMVKDSDKKCPHCGEKFESEEQQDKTINNNIDQKFSDLKKLKELLDEKIITKEEFEKEKKKILK